MSFECSAYFEYMSEYIAANLLWKPVYFVNVLGLFSYISLHFQSLPQGDGVGFTCQHGPDECAGNKIHSCGLQAAQTQAAQVEFVTCQMSYGVEGSDLVRKILINNTERNA